MRARINGITVIIILAFALVLVQAVLLQVRRASALDRNALNERVIQQQNDYPRGEILSATGTVLARSIPTKDSFYQYRRSYPLGRLVSGIVGYVSTYYGTGGLESEYGQYLVAHQQTPTSITQLLSPVVAEDDVTLTLNVALQQVAARALDGRVGAVVALNPKTGSVLALYSNPTFNPIPLTSLNKKIQVAAWREDTTRDVFGYQPFNNVATGETYPPGSTFKVVTTSAIERYYPALANYYFPISTCIGFGTVSNKHLCNDGGTPCGGTIAEMLPASCDPGYGFLGEKLGGTDLFDEATQFGYNADPPLDLGPIASVRQVVPSFFPGKKYFYPENGGLPALAYSAIGQQNVRSTALQDALVAAGIANGGVVMKPHLLQRIIDQQGRTVLAYKPSEWRHPLGKAEALVVNGLMQAVAAHGTAQGIFLYQDQVAAKTGTAQTGNLAQNTDDWMIAFAPASDPVVAAAVVVPYQAVSAYGATVAGPVMKCVIEAALAIDAHQPPANTATTCPS